MTLVEVEMHYIWKAGLHDANYYDHEVILSKVNDRNDENEIGKTKMPLISPASESAIFLDKYLSDCCA